MGGKWFGLALVLAGSLVSIPALAAEPKPGDRPPLITTAEAEMLAAELSGVTAKSTIGEISRHHRMRGSEGFRAAAELIQDRLTHYGLEEVELISLPADGILYYGTQRSRPAWNASFAELREQKPKKKKWVDGDLIASWAENPLSLAQDSISGRAEGELVDVGAGTAESDYAGKDVRGKLVLVSAQPGAAAPLAVGKYGAAGIVSWAQNQKQAWWGEDAGLIRWGHLDTWEHPTFAFMVSPDQAGEWKEQMAGGKAVRLRAHVEAKREPGAYLIPTAVIPGRNRVQEIVFSCHLDHPNPGANDNASGCAAILEIARGLQALIKAGKLPQPERTIRFVWPSEIEATIALLNARPAVGVGAVANVHMDMVGGRHATTKSVLRVGGSPPSLPSFIGDVGFALARWVNDQSLAYADTGTAAFPLTEPGGEKDALRAVIGGFSEGSDHQVWTEGSWRVATLYVNDWPDRYIHTDRDVPANIDPTKVKRAMFIAAASAWYLANVGKKDSESLFAAVNAEGFERAARTARQAEAMRLSGAPVEEIGNLMSQRVRYEIDLRDSVTRFGLTSPIAARAREAAAAAFAAPAPIRGDNPIYLRRPALKGPMDGFGYSWFDDRLKQAGLERPKLLDRVSPHDGPSFGYEALNLVDGKRNVQDIRNALAASAGPVPVDEVAQYLAVLERLGVIERKRR